MRSHYDQIGTDLVDCSRQFLVQINTWNVTDDAFGLRLMAMQLTLLLSEIGKLARKFFGIVGDRAGCNLCDSHVRDGRIVMFGKIGHHDKCCLGFVDVG